MRIQHLPALLILAGSLTGLSAHTQAADFNYQGAIFTMNNAVDGNEVIVLGHRKGRLTNLGHFPTGGMGTGGGLGNQGALELTDNLRWLLVVNAGDNTVSSLKVTPHGLKIADVVDADGERPISVTVHHNLVYVVNAASDSIAGFRLTPYGKLKPIKHSVQVLSSTGTGPAQIEFNPAGDTLVVTEKATNRIMTFPVNDDGVAGPGIVNPSAGVTPFGFNFDRRGHLIVTEAQGGAPDGSTVSSYDIQGDGLLNAISAQVATTETAACWVEVPRYGRFAFTANTPSNTLTSLRIKRDGSLELRDSDGETAHVGSQGRATDLASSRWGDYLFALSASTQEVYSFRITKSGGLIPVDVEGNLAATLNGLAAF